MPRTSLTVNSIARAGIDMEALLVAGDSANGHVFTNDGKLTFVAVNNADVASKTVTIITPRTVEGLAVADPPVTVAASERKLIGPFPTDTFNNQSGADAGKVYLDLSDDTSVTIGVFKI